MIRINKMIINENATPGYLGMWLEPEDFPFMEEIAQEHKMLNKEWIEMNKEFV